MSLEIENNRFYVLEIGDRKWIFKTEKEAIEALKEKAKSEDVDPEKINVLEVDLSKEKWEVRGIPWSKIALQLIKGT